GIENQVQAGDVSLHNARSESETQVKGRAVGRKDGGGVGNGGERAARGGVHGDGLTCSVDGRHYTCDVFHKIKVSRGKACGRRRKAVSTQDVGSAQVYCRDRLRGVHGQRVPQ